MIIAAVISAPLLTHAQVGNVLKRLKNTATSTAENKASNEVSSGVSKGIDNVLARKEKKKKKEQENDDSLGSTEQPNETAAKPSVKPGLKAYSKFDFVPGEKVMYAEDFSKDVIGEMPLLWTSKGRGEIMELENIPGKWLRGYEESQLISVNKNELGENYTVEFDLVYYFAPAKAAYVMPDIRVKMLNNVVDMKNRSRTSEHEGENSFSFSIHPKNEDSKARVETYGGAAFRSDELDVPEFSHNYNQVLHYSIQVQKSRLRIWVNENKIFDLPQALNFQKKMARISFSLGSSNYKDEEVGFYVSNIKFATGLPDTRHKLLAEGKFSTSGILFAVNSSDIQASSYGMIKEIATVLKENADVKIKIVGHTSSDGNAESNLTLSKQRAVSVKSILVKEFAIDELRLTTDGKGDAQPVTSNTTNEGKAQNRRVEFIKL